MEEKVATLAPPINLNPKNGERVERLVLEGTGEPGAAILIESNFLTAEATGPWVKKTEVKPDGHWQYIVTDKMSERPQEAWFRTKQEQYWPPETSEPSEKISFTKLLSPPIIKKPLTGESLPWINQEVEGTAYIFSRQIEIELTTVPPLPINIYKSNTAADQGGWWKATPKWSLDPGQYLLKCRQIYNEHTSGWSDDIPVSVGDSISRQ